MMPAARLLKTGQPPVFGEAPTVDGIRVSAAPITPLDLLCASGTSYFGVPATPYIPGVQGVGMMDIVPVWFATSAGMKPGDGSMASYVSVPPEDIVELPEGVDAVMLAALGLSAVAALMALTWRGELFEGEQVVVLGGGGVVGQAALQLARLHGARRVVAGVRSPAARVRAESAGADAVVELTTEDVGELASRFAAVLDGPADLVLDPLFGAPAAAAARVLKPGGRLVNLGSSAAETCPIDSSTLRSRSLRLLGYTNTELTVAQRADAIGRIAGLCREGKLSVTHERFPLEGVAAAWTRQAEGAANGRIVLTP